MDTPVNNGIPISETAIIPDFREQLFEVLTFCFLIIPGLAFSFTAGDSLKENFLIVLAVVILNDLALVTLVYFFLWHNGEKVLKIGWIPGGFVKEVFIGILLYFPMIYGISFLENLLESAGLPFPKGHIPSFFEPEGIIQQIAATIMIVVVAFSEETIFRGYLMLRFKSITNSRAATVILSSVIFSIGHGYEGIGGVIIVGIMGALFSIIYLWRKSLVAPIVMHFMQDIFAIVLISYIT